MVTKRHQRGMTGIGWLIVLGLIAFSALVTLRLLPAYMEYFKVVATMKSVLNEPDVEDKSKYDIGVMIDRRFSLDDVERVSAKNISIDNSKGGLTLGIKYEVRQHLLNNIDVVVKFDKTVKK